MAAGRLLLPSWMPALDGDGFPIPNAKVYFYLNLKTTLAPVYADEELSIPLANPVEANSSGRFPAVWADGDALYSASIDAPYGPAGVPFTYDNLSASLGADILIAGAAETAANEAAQSLADIEDAIQAAQDADGVAAMAGAIAGQAAGQASAEAVIGTKQDTTFVSAPSILRGVANKLTQDFHFFDIVVSPSDQAAIRAGTSVTDWSDAIDEAMARLLVANQNDPGKVMTFPDGEIRLSRTLAKPYGAGLFARGREFTRIINTSSTGHVLTIPEFDRGAIVSGISIERNVTSAAGTYGIYINHGTSGIILDKVRVRRCQNGIFAGSTDYGTIIQPEIDDCYNDGWVQQDTKPAADPDIPTNYDPAVQWQLEKPLVRWCQEAAFRVVASGGGRGHIVGEWKNPGTFENGRTMVFAGAAIGKGINDIRVNDGFVGSDNYGPDVESYGKNNEFNFNVIERMGLDSYGPRFNPDGTARTRSTPGGAGYGRGFRAGTSNERIRLVATIDDTAGYGVIQACDMIADVSVRNPGIDADATVGIIQFAGQLAGQVVADTASASVQFGTDEGHILTVSGAPVTGVSVPTSSILSPDGFVGSVKVGGASLLTGLETGFVAITGTARKATFPTYGGGTAGAAYTQAQIQGIMDALVAVSERLKAHDDALIGKKIPST